MAGGEVLNETAEGSSTCMHVAAGVGFGWIVALSWRWPWGRAGLAHPVAAVSCPGSRWRNPDVDAAELPQMLSDIRWSSLLPTAE